MAKKILGGLVVIILIAGAFLFYRQSQPPKPELPERGIVTADPATERILDTGSVVGFVDKHESHAWLGIPFARPPVGNLRWKAPRPAVSWADTYETLEYGNICTQLPSLLIPEGASGESPVVGEEDCLYLNVWAPPYPPDDIPSGEERLPVMFWIHGGGNSLGSGSQEVYNGSAMATTHKVIVVTMNYRLGPFGWFAHPALRSAGSSDEDNSGNYGLLDIISALRWVQGNITAFGGDPDNVTIYGESAGAANVLSMMISPMAKGLFHRAIVQSGGMWSAPMYAAENYKDDPKPGHPYSSREIINLSLIRDGLAANREEAKAYQDRMTDKEIIDYLYGKSRSDIITLYPDRTMGMLDMPDTFADGSVLPFEPIDAVFAKAGAYNDVPVILGTNRDEEKLFMVRDPQNLKQFLWIFPRLKNPAAYERRARYITDSWKVNGVDHLATLLRKSQGPSVFAYRFDWDEEPSVMGYDLSAALGAAHGLDIYFIFHNFFSITGTPLFQEDKVEGRNALSRSMMSYWAEFAYTGTPGRGRSGKEVLWKPWDNRKGEENLIVFDTTEDKGIRMVSETMTHQDIKKRFLADTSYASQEEYCRMYVELFRYNFWDQEEYENLGKEGCRDYDPDKFAL